MLEKSRIVNYLNWGDAFDTLRNTENKSEKGNGYYFVSKLPKETRVHGVVH